MDDRVQKLANTLMCSAEIEVISFDFFDTLFYRPGFEPSDIFYLLDYQAAQLLGISDFVEIRTAAENEMAAATPSYLNLHTLEDIYLHIAKVHNLDHKKCLELYRLELKIESTTLRPRRDIRKLYKRAVSLQKRIIVVSDTYFTKSFIEDVLEKNGFSKISEVYVSNECGRRKDIGDIYSYVLEREHVKCSQVLHIGDNFHSDVEMALAAGVQAVHCPAIVTGLLELRSGQWLEAIGNYRHLDPAARLLLGLAINDWFTEYSPKNNNSLFEDNLAMFGFVGLGPILFHIAHEIVESRDIQESYPNINFASRDGYLPMRAYDLLSEERGKIPSRYIYCGRMAYDSYRYKGDPAAFISERTQRANEYTLRSLLTYLFQMKDSELYNILIDEFSEQELALKYLDNHKTIEQVCVKYDDRLREFFANERQLASEYYSENIMQSETNRSIIFDVGYGGSVSRAIGALTGIQIDKVYLNGNDQNEKSDSEYGTSTRTLIADSDELICDVPGIFLLFEELFSPAEPACVGFRRDGQILPVFDTSEVFEPKMLEDLRTIQDAALSFVRVAKETFGELLPYLRVKSATHLLRPVQYALGRSVECEERMFKNILFSDLFFLNQMCPLSTKVVHYPEYGNMSDKSGFTEPSRIISNSNMILAQQFKIGIHFHLSDNAFLQPMFLALSQITENFDLFISVNSKKLSDLVKNVMKSLQPTLPGNTTITLISDDGFTTHSWINTIATCGDNYDLLCYFSTNSPDGFSKMTSSWLQHLIDNVLTPSAISGILSCFSNDLKLGLLFPPAYYEAFSAMRMAPSGIVPQPVRHEMNRLLAEMDIHTGYNRSDLFFPIGDVFWCRPTALQPLVDLLKQEALSKDTSAAVTRLLTVVSSSEGFLTKSFIPDDRLLRSFNTQHQKLDLMHREMASMHREMASVRQEVDIITGSRSWKAALLISTVSKRLLPNGSRRRKLVAKSLRGTRRIIAFIKKPKKGTAKLLITRFGAVISNNVHRLKIRAKIHTLNRFNADNPMFSVIIPIYNRTWQLELAIESILNQKFRNFELILVCDGSPAETLEVVDRYAMHPQVRIHKFLDNSGNACRGRNKGIEMARGSYVAFMDSDDIAVDDRLGISLFYFLHTGADMVYGSVTIISDGLRKIDGVWDGQFRKSFGLSLEEMEDVNPAWTCTVSVRREALQRFGGFRMMMRYREDQELWLRLAYNGCKLYPVPEMLAYYRFHENNAELLFKDQDEHWKTQMLKVYRQPYEG